MVESDYGKDARGKKQSAMIPLSRIRMADINCLFMEFFGEVMDSERRSGEVDCLTLEVEAELAIMVRCAKRNERKVR